MPTTITRDTPPIDYTVYVYRGRTRNIDYIFDVNISTYTFTVETKDQAGEVVFTYTSGAGLTIDTSTVRITWSDDDTADMEDDVYYADLKVELPDDTSYTPPIRHVLVMSDPVTT